MMPMDGTLFPYLDQGEFYSEYGRFDVRITVPKNYVLAATGVLQNEDEKKWLIEKSLKNEEIGEIQSAAEFKTLQYIQDSVHDFAWFCSKQFNVKKGEVVLKSGKKVDTWLFAKNVNDKGVDYANEAIKYYSEHLGEYPYTLAQVVITPLLAGGGMEYPTITNCIGIDRTTIIHEVGHNWFYGILGSNEREYPWMDESLNTYYENRCGMEDAKSKQKTTGGRIDAIVNAYINSFTSGFNQSKLLFNLVSRRNEDQPGSLNSTKYSNFNYGSIIYAKNPLSFYYLQNYLEQRFLII